MILSFGRMRDICGYADGLTRLIEHTVDPLKLKPERCHELIFEQIRPLEESDLFGLCKCGQISLLEVIINRPALVRIEPGSLIPSDASSIHLTRL